MRTANFPIFSAPLFRPLLGVLGAFFLITVAHARTLNLSFQLSQLQYSQLDPNYPGESYYTVGVLLYTATTNQNDEVDSPDLSFVGTETGNGETYFGDLSSVLEAITNGTWTLYVNKGSPAQQQYSFTVSATGVTTNDFGAVQIYMPADAATGVPTNTSFSWLGPTNWDGVQVAVHSLDYSFYDGASFPASTTEWPSPALVPPGTNEFEVTYMTNGNAWLVISTPTNTASQPFTNWVSNSTLATFVQSGFVVGTATNALPPVYSGHTLLAHYTFDDDTIYTADTSGRGNDITGSTGNGGASTIYITNNAAAGPYAAAFYAPQNPDYTYSGSWLIPPTNLLATLAGSFSASLWLRSTDVFAGDSYPAADGEGLLSEDYTIIFTNNINYSAPGNVIPMALTGHKLAFLTGDNVGGEDDTLHSTANIDTGAYVHLVVTRDQVTGEKKIYVNGQLDASDFGSSATLNTPQQIAIGALELVPEGGSLFSNIHGINGELDDIQIYSGVLASNDVAYIFNHPGSPAADVSGPQEDPLAVSLNAPQLVWTTSGDALWFPEAATNFDGLSAAQSGAVGAGQSSTLQTLVTNGTGGTAVSFEWQTETVDTNFTLTFYVDGQVAGQLTDTTSWTAFPACKLGPGTHTLKWVASVTAAGTGASLNDTGWVDVVRLVPIPLVYASDSPTVGQGPLAVQFTSPALDTLSNVITSWNWSFGDGAVSQAQNPTHTYTNIGTYFVSLATTDSSGAAPTTLGLTSVTVTSESRTNVLKNLPGSFVGFTYNSFTNTKSLQFLGNATNATTSDGAVLQLTQSAVGQDGAAFTAVPLAFGPNAGFSTFFTFRLSKPGGLVDTDGVQGGDGIAFLIQSAGYVYGTGGGGIGYEGISNSLAVEFDTWNNGTQNGIPGDINGNHVAVNINGVLNDSVSVSIPDAMNNGSVWYAWIDYEGVSQDLEVRLSEIPVRPLAPTLDLDVNLPAILGTTNAFVGFTGGTGAAYNEEDVLAWKFAALPTTRFTGTFSFTNVPAGFSLNYGIVLAKDVYTVAGHTFTNYSFVPLDTISNANAKIAFASKIAELAPPDNFTLPDPNSLEIALSNNAAALDAADFMTYAVFASYENADANVEGAVLNTYDNGTGFSPFLQNADYSTRYPGYESDYVNSIYNMNQNSYPGLNPDPSIVALAESGARLGQPAGQQIAQLLASADPDGNYDYDSESFTVGTELGGMVTRRQVLYSPPLPLNLFSARGQGTNFVFDFGTVSNESYTVWGNTNITSTNWVSLTNILGDGYIQKIAEPLTNRNRSFYRVSSP